MQIFYAKGKEKKEVIANKAIVTSADKLASEAGIEMLKKGGNAVDAAVATSFAIGVVEPFMSSIGGGGVINIRMSDGTECAIDSFVMAPNKAMQFDWSTNGIKVAAVPGLLDGLCIALEKYGTMKLSEVLAPAIRYAEEGFIVSEYASRIIRADMYRLNGAAAKILLKDGLSRPIKEGERLINADYAKTLKKIATDGKDAFFKGEIADKIVKYMNENGGLITHEDLASYKARVLKPMKTSYKGYTINSIPGAHGGVTVAHIMKILEKCDIKSLGHNTVQSIQLIAEAEKRAFFDRLTLYGDAEYTNVPWDGLISDEYAKEIRENIEINKSSGIPRLKDPWKYSKVDRPNKIQSTRSSQGDDTTSLSVFDSEGNAVCITQSLGMALCSFCIPETGIFLNGFMFAPEEAGFDPNPEHPNYISPHKRPVNNHCPSIVIKDDKVFMLIGSPAGRRQQGACVQTMLNVIEHGMGIQEAISAPRIHCEQNTINIEGRIPEKTQKALESMGYNIIKMPDYSMFFGGANGIFINRKENKVHGGADPRRVCTAVGLD